MNAVSQPRSTPILVVLAVFAVANAIDFIFYGQHLYNLAALIGLSVAAFGVAKNQTTALNCGTVVAIAGIVAKYI
ncbi:hypothetical protein [Stenotrophomonas bentonitica]|uniref:hypothetical protein n=1 Tax=Stenotrophomonas bentonitica TaxID=1450134 RepID=UPI00345F08EA